MAAVTRALGIEIEIGKNLVHVIEEGGKILVPEMTLADAAVIAIREETILEADLLLDAGAALAEEAEVVTWT